MQKIEIIKYVESIKQEHYDPALLDYNLTSLAKDAADHFGHDDWLDDESHPLWEIVSDVTQS